MDATARTRATPPKRATLTRVSRSDRWYNFANGFGASNDPVTRTSFAPDVTMTRGLLEDLFRYDWVTRRAVEIPAKDSTRKFITLLHENPKRLQDAEREVKRLNIRAKVFELIVLARLYGGAMLLLGLFDGREVTEPLGRVRQVMWLANVDRYLAYPITFYMDPEDEKYGDPLIYQINRPLVIKTDSVPVHESRLIRLDGNYLPPLQRIKNFTWGASIVESILEASRQFGTCSQGLAGVVQDFVTKKLKVANLADLLQDAEGEASLMTRVGALAASMSMFGIATFGADEEFDKMGTPITGLPDIADRFVEYVSAATDIPRSRFFNNLSGRLGGDAGENDLTIHYDNIKSYQETQLTDPVQRLLDVVLEPIGFEPGEVTFEWQPLWEMGDKERAELRLAVAQTDQIYIQTGVLQPEEVAVSRFGGDGVNVEDMNIEAAPREKFLAEFAKSEPRSGDLDGQDGQDMNAGEPDEDDAQPAKPNGQDKEKGNGAAKH